MRRKFNVTGSCNQQRHYMVDISDKYDQAFRFIDEGEYFAINRPRQYGKTTLLDCSVVIQFKPSLVAYLSR